MTKLRLINGQPSHALTPADLFQLETVARLLPHLRQAVRELEAGVAARDMDLTMRASRRFIGFGGLLGEVACEIERRARR